MKVVVTGGSGQLGSLVIERLLAASSEVVSLDVRPSRIVHPKLRSIVEDVRSRELAKAFDGASVVVHLAFVVARPAPRHEIEAINVGGSENVFRAALAVGARIVYASSIAAYGCVRTHPRPIVEETRRVRQPHFTYARTKFDVEAILDRLEREHPRARIARLRPAILVGRNMEHVLGDLLRAGLLADTGRAPLPVVWDEDVADAFVKVVESEAHGAWNLVARECLPPVALARRVPLRVVRLPFEAVLLAARIRRLWAIATGGFAVDPSWLEAARVPVEVSAERAARELDWRPRAPTATSVFERYLSK